MLTNLIKEYGNILLSVLLNDCEAVGQVKNQPHHSLARISLAV
jgi:hypothetical protein